VVRHAQEVVEVVGMILDKLKAYGAIAAALVLAVLLAAQSLRLHTEQLAHEKLKTQVAQDATQRADAALKNETKVGLKEFGHAAATQENSDVYTTSQPVRDAIARADAARHNRLLDGAEKRAATYRAMAEAGAAACSDLADRHAALDRHVVEGVNVVSALRRDLVRRDAEVALLRRQIDIERALME
jgi:hypothetical protein